MSEVGCVVTVRWAPGVEEKGLLVSSSNLFSYIYFQDAEDLSLRYVPNEQIVDLGAKLTIPELVNIPSTEPVDAAA